MQIRIATVNDADEILDIYAPYVENTAITFEYDVPDTVELERRIENTVKSYPYLVAVDNSKIVGYSYAGPFRPRAAYKHSAEVSIYLDEKIRGNGIGTLLYQELEKQLIRQNVFILYASITTTDRKDDANLTDASIRFHDKFGYTIIGRHDRCGYKFGKWYSMIWMEKVIVPLPDNPDSFIPFSEILAL